MKIEFDHSAKTFSDGIGFSKKEIEDLTDKLNLIANLIPRKQLSQTQIAEMLAKELSYKELLYVATTGLRDTVISKLEQIDSLMKQHKIPQLGELDDKALNELSEQGIIDLGAGVSIKVVKASSEEGQKFKEMLGINDDDDDE